MYKIRTYIWEMMERRKETKRGKKEMNKEGWDKPCVGGCYWITLARKSLRQ